MALEVSLSFVLRQQLHAYATFLFGYCQIMRCSHSLHLVRITVVGYRGQKPGLAHANTSMLNETISVIGMTVFSQLKV